MANGRRNAPWFRVHSEQGLEILRRKLRELYHYNCWTLDHRDKNGNPISLVGYDWKPDSDWGKVDAELNVWFESDALYEKGIEIIKAGEHEAKSETTR